MNGGTCFKPNQCACPQGWTGHQCQTGIHTNTWYPFPWLFGMQMFLSHVLDVNECSEQRPCAHKCVNTAGSYRCACRDGFRLIGDGRSCQSLPPPHTTRRPPSPARPTVGGHTDTGKYGRWCMCSYHVVFFSKEDRNIARFAAHYYFWYALCHPQLVPWVIMHCDWCCLEADILCPATGISWIVWMTWFSSKKKKPRMFYVS